MGFKLEPRTNPIFVGYFSILLYRLLLYFDKDLFQQCKSAADPTVHPPPPPPPPAFSHFDSNNSVFSGSLSLSLSKNNIRNKILLFYLQLSSPSLISVPSQSSIGCM